MSRIDPNITVFAGNLTRDPELRRTNSGTAVTTLRVASNARRKGPDGEYHDKPNYIDVTVFGVQAENCCQFLSTGSRVTVQGELDFREWTDQATQQNRNALGVLAQLVSFEGPPKANGNGQAPAAAPAPAPAPAAQQPVAAAPALASVAGADDIPF